MIGLAATRERPANPAVFLPYRSYLAWKARSRSFDEVSATFRRAYLISGSGDATTAMGMAVTEEFFSLVLAAIGVYGLVMQSVARRLREIGIRLALGAEANRVLWTIARGTLAAGCAGLVCGSVAAFVLANTMKSVLYGVAPTDAWSFVAAGAALLAVTALAAIVPARRLTRIDPARILRAD